jgi:hypothetical protein
VELETVGLSLDKRMRTLQEELSTVNQATQATRKESLANIEAARCEFLSHLEDVETWAENGRGIQNSVREVEPPIFPGTSSWTVFRRQFDIVLEYNFWTHQKKSTLFIIDLQWRTTYMLRAIPKGTTYEEAIQTLVDHFEDQYFAAAYRND